MLKPDEQVQEALRARDPEKPLGVVLYRGPSRMDGSPIAVVLTGVRARSKNTKTGDMLQTWVLREDLPPHDAVREGLDDSICGTCPLASGNGCYVRVEQGPLAVWRALQAGKYLQASGRAQATRILRQVARGRNLRIGAYGDPGACPRWVWDAAVFSIAPPKRTGYTHAWETPFEADLQGTCMASVHTPEQADRAHALGYRTFRTGADGPREGEIVCPATEEGGNKTTCDRCGLCDGSKGPNDRRKNIFAYLHGARKNTALVAIGG